jgi:hypothetical protein
VHKQLDEIADFLGSLKFSLFVDLHELFSSCDVTRRVGRGREASQGFSGLRDVLAHALT